MKMSARTREVIVILVLLAISLVVNIPGYLKNKVAYEQDKKARAAEAEIISRNDRWVVSSPEKEGMNPELLKQGGKLLDNTKAVSLIVVRHGNIVLEKYYTGSSFDSNQVFSVTKSVTSSLVGIAIQKGHIKSVDQKVLDFLPDYVDRIDSPAKKEITIRQLLTMTPGFLEDLNAMVTAPDWVEYIFKLPLKYKPGEKYQYANASSHLLSVVLSKATGMTTLDFAEKNLFGPLGITKKQWDRDRKGYYTGYANLSIRPRDMAKLGQLYLNKGKWNGTQIVPAEWVEESTRKQVSKDANTASDSYNGYGYQWHTGKIGNYPIYHASGAGGQGIIVVPELDLVTVVTAIQDPNFGVTDSLKELLMRDYIIPTCK